MPFADRKAGASAIAHFGLIGIVAASCRYRLFRRFAREQLPRDNVFRVAQEALMPFDCAPIIDAPKSLPALDGDVLDFGTKSPKTDAVIARPIPAWHVSRWSECVGYTLAVLVRARALLADE